MTTFSKNRAIRFLLIFSMNIFVLLFIYPILSIAYRSPYIPHIVACLFAFFLAESVNFSSKTAKIITISVIVFINLLVVVIVDFGIYEANQCLVPWLPECGYQDPGQVASRKAATAAGATANRKLAASAS